MLEGERKETAKILLKELISKDNILRKTESSNMTNRNEQANHKSNYQKKTKLDLIQSLLSQSNSLASLFATGRKSLSK